MGSGTISYKKLQEKKKVYGNKDFFIRPLNLGLDVEYKAFIIRPSAEGQKDFFIDIEGEFNIGAGRFKETKEEYKNEEVLFVYYKSEINLFSEKIREDVINFCDKMI